jgi:CCR4-NOT transcription complex subunit 4
MKIVVNKTKAYNPNGPNGPSYSAYISYSTEQEASIAILAIDNIEVDDHILRASYGTTKYCTFFLKNLDCPNKDCLYLHHLADDGDIINRDDMNSNTNIFYEQQLLAMKIGDIFNIEIKKKLKNTNPKKKCIFPTTESIYTKDIVLEQNNEYNNYRNFDSSFKNKKKYNDDYYNNYYGNTKYSDYQKDYFYEEECDNFLTREKSENFTSNKKYSISNKKAKPNFESDEGSTAKFISKSKSPITTKKKNIPDEELSPGKVLMNSVSPKKIEMGEVIEKNSTDHDNTKPSPPLKKLYRKRDESRFSFAKSPINKSEPILNSNNITTIKESDEKEKIYDEIVPDYVCDVICKKISRHTFFKKFDKYFIEKENQDYLFFEKELKQNDSWSKFILSNMNTGNSNKEKIK